MPDFHFLEVENIECNFRHYLRMSLFDTLGWGKAYKNKNSLLQLDDCIILIECHWIYEEHFDHCAQHAPYSTHYRLMSLSH